MKTLAYLGLIAVLIVGCGSSQTPTVTDSPTGPPTATGTSAPTSPPSALAGIVDGTYRVGQDIAPGTYRLREPATLCYWARLSGFSGDVSDILANDNVDGYAVITIAPTDAGFETARCGTWSKDLSAVIAPDDPIPAGTLIVGTDVAPGTYTAADVSLCYWARLKGFSGTSDDIIDNDNVMSGNAIVTIAATDKGFSSARCGDWTH